MSNQSKALVVLSGGQDSTTCLVWAQKYFQEVHAITFNYGQRHAREIEAAQAVGDFAKVASHELVHLGNDILAGTSPLTDKNAELEKYSDYQSMDKIIGDRVEKTFVPMRNALFLTIAANRAAVKGISSIVTGVCQADNANYPDCRQSFISAQEEAINQALGTVAGQRFSILTPLMHMSKAESIKLMDSLGGYALLAFTHTAYDGQYPPNGKDHASVLRAHGFEEAGLPDPLVVRAVVDGLMFYPPTPNYSEAKTTAVEMMLAEFGYKRAGVDGGA